MADGVLLEGALSCL